MNQNKDYDIVVYGSSGFTGYLVTEYLWERYGSKGTHRVAIAGRNREKLLQVRTSLGATDDLGLFVADAADRAALYEMTAQTRAVISTVGPYQLHGTPLVEACAAAGTDYLDLCAEPHWIRQMIELHSATARHSGARLLFSCGFDSIPSEIGVLEVQDIARRTTGSPSLDVTCFVREMKGGFSGGTAESLNANARAAAADSSIAEVLQDPFALTPGFRGIPQPDSWNVAFHEDVGVWSAPSMMAFINTRTVHRLNYLLGGTFGLTFRYTERVATGSGEEGKRAAHAFLSLPSPLEGESAPKPGSGPSKEERDNGSFNLLFVGRTHDGALIKVGVSGDNDPGYGATSKMISEAAIALLADTVQCEGGIWTPGAALGASLKSRLVNNAGIRVWVED